MREWVELAGKLGFADTSQARVACVLLLDTSSSMRGEPIAAVNAGLHSLKDSLTQDAVASMRVEVAVVTFGDDVRVVHGFVTARYWQPIELVADGCANMDTLGNAIERALDMLDIRRQARGRNTISLHRFHIMIVTDKDFEGDKAAVIEAAEARIKEREFCSQIALTVIVV